MAVLIPDIAKLFFLDGDAVFVMINWEDTGTMNFHRITCGDRIDMKSRIMRKSGALKVNQNIKIINHTYYSVDIAKCLKR